MALYKLTKEDMEEISTTTFSNLGYRERDDLQRLLRERIQIIVPDGMVIAEEFGDWDSSSRRIDLLVLDRDANLVVVELKRTEDGGHSELQALRYAAMISMVTFEQIVEAHRSYLAGVGSDKDPQLQILEFLDWTEPDEDRFAQEVRIVLASAEFSKELTTSVIWLNDQGIDIRCVRMKPYQDNGNIIVDVQQILPLPEAQDYQVRVREKMSSEKTARRDQTERQQKYLAFWTGLLKKANQKTPLHLNISPTRDYWIAATSSNIGMGYVVARGKGRVEIYLDRSNPAENKAIFDELFAKRGEIEAAFGESLDWKRLDNNISSRITHHVTSEGSYLDEASWGQLQDDMVDAMVKFDAAFAPHIQKYRDGATVVVEETL